MDLAAFIAERRPVWARLEADLDDADRRGLGRLSVDEARALGRLYREVSGDLLLARSKAASVGVVDYLNALVARAHARIHPSRRPRLADVRRFYARGFPRLVRAERRAIALSAVCLFAGVLFGAGAMAVDGDAWVYLVPAEHQHFTPKAHAEQANHHVAGPGNEAAFSAFLFTHNIRVTVLTFAVGVFAGILTALLLFLNGVMLGSLAWVYATRGYGLFFWAWILPHGVLELSAVVLGGGAGFVLGGAVLAPGRLRRSDALREAAGRAVRLLLGLAPILVVAGLVEGSLSQWGDAVVSPWLKLAFAAAAGSLLWLYLLRAGRDPDAAGPAPGTPTLAPADPPRRGTGGPG